MPNVQPILYSFRRCPYAMRARLALEYVGIKREHREIELKNKPAHMLKLSPKGTVPVIALPSGRVIDESFDIMIWALSENDPYLWLPDMHRFDVYDLIERNDTIFKPQLDRFKYPNRYPEEDCSSARENALKFLTDLNSRIAANGALSGENTTLADMAIFPFIRQFSNVDKNWFTAQNLKPLQKWLNNHITSDLFKKVMEKHPLWSDDVQI